MTKLRMKKLLIPLFVFVLIFSSCDGGMSPTESVSSVEIVNDKTTLEVGSTLQLSIKTEPANAAVTYTSSDETVLTVSNNGLVTALKAGVATVTAKAGDKSAEITLTVIDKVQGEPDDDSTQSPDDSSEDENAKEMVDLGLDGIHFESWLIGDYVGYINDPYFGEGLSYLNFSESDFTLSRYSSSASSSFSTMYGSAELQEQKGNGVDKWTCTLNQPQFGIIYTIEKTSDGIVINYEYTHGSAVINSPIELKKVSNFKAESTTAFVVPSWAVGTFSGYMDWNGYQEITAAIDSNGNISISLADGTSHTFNSFYGDITIIKQYSYDDSWDVTFSSSNYSSREATFYHVEKSENGIKVYCVSDVAKDYISGTEIDLAKKEDVEDFVMPSETIPADVTATASNDDLDVYQGASYLLTTDILQVALSQVEVSNMDLGDFKVSHSGDVGKTTIETQKDIQTTVNWYYYGTGPDDPHTGTANVTIKSGSTYEGTNSSIKVNYNFTYDGVEYVYTTDSNDLTDVPFTLTQGDQNIDDDELNAIADGIFNYISNNVMASLLSSDTVRAQVEGKTITMAGASVHFYNFDYSTFLTNGLPTWSLIASFNSFESNKWANGAPSGKTTYSSVGITCDINGSTQTIKVRGPLTVGGVEYYFDVTSKNNTISGGLKSGGEWKTISIN